MDYQKVKVAFTAKELQGLPNGFDEEPEVQATRNSSFIYR
jgi:hypothetical protein